MNNLLGGIGMNLDVEKMAKEAVKKACNPHDLGLTGYCPNVIYESETNHFDVDPRITGSQFCSELQNTYDGKFKRMYPMLQHQYSQMIPNPERPDELFVVQFNEDLSREKITPDELENTKEFQDGLSLAQRRMKYVMAPTSAAQGDSEDDDEDSYGREEEDGENKQEGNK